MNKSLNNLLCFNLYLCSKEIVRKYEPFLKKYKLTYTQLIVIYTLAEHKKVNIKGLGDYLYLDSGTLTPLLKKLESRQLINRMKKPDDDRQVLISLTEEGLNLYQELSDIPKQVGDCLNLENVDEIQLNQILQSVLKQIK